MFRQLALTSKFLKPKFKLTSNISIIQPTTLVHKFNQRHYSSELDPSEKKDYAAYVSQWKEHFKTIDDDWELERGLNHIFAADWVPSLDVIEEAIRASRRLNCFATAVRVLDALENKVENRKQYDDYLTHLNPLLTELGVVERKEFGKFETVRDKTKWWY
ncbi:Cytochrome c oxidase subunit 6 [Clydaea vesicula]|uniref:Cytochrome c oxidase subunit 6, mitochondrial n=1 Tax=Clydaea vesicula TaxID=447962 RepID=A0AAD5TY11_9FUNG|nr:Cytochrome c oxidase subunit 6 [Clydaea vesicula]KAJ3381332.1 Cytochrome c oxidase subunit 6 [Lobulomyces angularis]